ncbi:hypothetical protein ACVDG5_022385 [Mesorhizobium sp. ORM6]
MIAFKSTALIIVGMFASPLIANAGQSQQMIDMGCAGVGTLAEATMRTRQRGTPIDQLFAAEDKNLASGVRDEMRAITIQAYKIPRFTSPIDQDVAITNFRDTIQLECLQGGYQKQ